MNAVGGVPWELSFSYGRALQATPLEAWSGDEANESDAQKAFAHRARCNGEARYGRYTEELEQSLAA
jgi:fructose-bisphosphate aldolase class I